MAPAKQNIYQMLEIPAQLINTIFIISLLSLIAPYVEGIDFGIFKVPVLPENIEKVLVILGPILILINVILFLPLFRIKEGKPPAGNDETAEKFKETLPKLSGIDDSRVNTGGYFQSVTDFQPYTIGKLVFIYGSLLDVDSLRSTIMRISRRVDCLPVLLKRFRRRWGAPSAKPDYVHRDWTRCEEHIEWLSLLIERTNSEQDVVPGAVINVDDETELRELCGRERNYELSELPSGSLFRFDGNPYDPPSSIYAFQADRFLDKPSSRYRIRQGYVDRINQSLMLIGKAFDGASIHPVQPIDPVIGSIETVEALAVNALVHDTLALQHDRLEKLYDEVKEVMIRDRAMWRTQADKRPRPISTVLCPVVLPDEVNSKAQRIAEAAVSLTTKATRLVIGDDELADYCRFDADDCALALKAIECGDDQVQVTRVDMTYDRGLLGVFEVNSDSPGGMYHFDKLATRFAGDMSSLGIERIEPVAAGLCDAVVDQLLMRWQQCHLGKTADLNKGSNLPRIGIVEHEFPRWQSLPEMLNLKALLRKRMKGEGNVFLCEAASLEYDGEQLTGQESIITIEEDEIVCSAGQRYPIDLVYKRVLHKDLRPKDSMGESSKSLRRALGALMRAYNENRICIVNSPLGLLAGNKSILAVLHLRDFERRLVTAGLPNLTDIERSLIENTLLPPTYAWRDQIDPTESAKVKNLVMNEKTPCFVLKPFDEHSGHGMDIKFTHDWQRRFLQLWNSDESPCIVQQFVPHGRLTVPVIDEVERELVERQMYFILGVYVIGGKAMGVEAKLGDDLPISMRVGKRGPRGYRTLSYPLKV